jgi:hypothetical protein
MFRVLSSRPLSERRLAFLDLALNVQFADEPLGRSLCQALAPWEERPTRSEKIARCVIDYTDAVPHWQEAFAGELRSLEDSFVGRMQMLRTEDGYGILLERLGAVARSAAGDLLCLVHDVEGKRYGRDPCNLDATARILMASCLLRQGYLMVHGGGVARRGRCHLWTGPSGVGKTTRVLDLVAQGWDYCGDDVLILGKVEKEGWHVFPCWRTAKATVETCARFPPLASLATEVRPGNKRTFQVDRVFPTTVPASATVDRIYCLDPEPGHPSRRLDASEAMDRLAPGFLYYLWPDDAERVLASFWDIVSEVPVYAVSRDLGLDEVGE